MLLWYSIIKRLTYICPGERHLKLRRSLVVNSTKIASCDTTASIIISNKSINFKNWFYGIDSYEIIVLRNSLNKNSQ